MSRKFIARKNFNDKEKIEKNKELIKYFDVDINPKEMPDTMFVFKTSELKIGQKIKVKDGVCVNPYMGRIEYISDNILIIQTTEEIKPILIPNFIKNDFVEITLVENCGL